MIIRCPYCNRHFQEKDIKEKFNYKENEILQNECFKLQKRIDKLEYKHDYEDLSSYRLNEVNIKLRTLKKILDILERQI